MISIPDIVVHDLFAKHFLNARSVYYKHVGLGIIRNCPVLVLPSSSSSVNSLVLASKNNFFGGRKSEL